MLVAQSQKCNVCSAEVAELRRGRCWGCYSRWAETRPVGLGATCTMCGERRRDVLTSVELLGSWVPCCQNCTAKVVKLRPLPQTLAGVRDALDRNRRDSPPRRYGKRDHRSSRRDRRTSDRRRVRVLDADDSVIIEDDMVVEIQQLADELAGREPSNDELTLIRELPLPAKD